MIVHIEQFYEEGVLYFFRSQIEIMSIRLNSFFGYKYSGHCLELLHSTVVNNALLFFQLQKAIQFLLCPDYFKSLLICRPRFLAAVEQLTKLACTVTFSRCWSLLLLVYVPVEVLDAFLNSTLDNDHSKLLPISQDFFVVLNQHRPFVQV